MIYAIRTRGRRETLVELEGSAVDNLYWAYVSGVTLREVDEASAMRWVSSGKEHETGLFINGDGEVVYAEAEMADDAIPADVWGA